MKIERLDHLVLTVADVNATTAFYSKAMGMTPVTFGPGRHALAFGQQKINLHPGQSPVKPHAAHPSPGSADLCFITSEPIADVITHPARAGVPIDQGPVARTGAMGPITSVYFRDPDGNLIEVSRYE